MSYNICTQLGEPMPKSKWIVYHRNSVVSRLDISVLSLPLTIKKARELLYTITTQKELYIKPA
jgi:hypothetical protein